MPQLWPSDWLPQNESTHMELTEGLNDHKVWPWLWPWKVRRKDLPDSDRGDFRCWRVVDSSSWWIMRFPMLNLSAGCLFSTKDNVNNRLVNATQIHLMLLKHQCHTGTIIHIKIFTLVIGYSWQHVLPIFTNLVNISKHHSSHVMVYIDKWIIAQMDPGESEINRLHAMILLWMYVLTAALTFIPRVSCPKGPICYA